MPECCYKTHREDLQVFKKIDAVLTSQFLRANTKCTSNQCHKASREAPTLSVIIPHTRVAMCDFY